MLRNYQTDAIIRIKESYKKNFKSPCLVAPCGAGKSIIVAEMAKQTTLKGNQVLFLVHRQELCEQIENTFMNWGVNMGHCQIAMVQTITRRLKTTKEPKLIITDENHHCLAKSYLKIYEHFPKAYKIGVTATPVRLNGSGLGEVNDILINTVSCKWLVKNNYLAPFDLWAPPIADFSKLKTKMGEYVIGEAEEILDKPAICGDVVKYYKKLADNKKAICYCVSVNHSKIMEQAFKDAGIKAAHIDGCTPNQERKEIIEMFRNGEIKILCNVDLISEGFDVPDCEVAILLRPTQSLTLYIQQSMRCMRYQDNKKAIIIDHVGNCFRHGTPDADRDWTLDPKKKQDDTPSVKQCLSCYYTYIPEKKTDKKCPKCGYSLPVEEISKPRVLNYIPDAELEKIEQEIVIDYRTPDDCNSLKELYELAKNRGYQKGWAWHQAKRRGLV